MGTLITSLTESEFSVHIENAVRKIFAEHSVVKTATAVQEKEILNIDEAAALLGLAKQTVYTLTSKREIPFFKRAKRLYFKRVDLLKFIDEGQQKSIAQMEQEVDRHLRRPTLNVKSK